VVECLTDGVDVVYGTPASEQHSLWRAAASRITKYALEEAMGATAARSVSAVPCFRTELRRGFDRHQSPDTSIDVLLTWATTRFAAVQVKHDARACGRSTYTVGRLLHHALNMVTGFNTRPWRLASLMGLLFTNFGAAVFVFVVVRNLIDGDAVPGFPFLTSIVAIFSGVQLLILGIMGEYVGMHLRLLERPPYVIGEETTDDEAPVVIDPPPRIPFNRRDRPRKLMTSSLMRSRRHLLSRKCACAARRLAGVATVAAHASDAPQVNPSL
jgi:hypothetical protein